MNTPRHIAFSTIIASAMMLSTPAPGEETYQHEQHEQHDEQHEQQHHQVLPPADIGDESIYQLESIWRNQKGEHLRLAALAGKPTVAAMIYTSCEYACPLIVRDMTAIYQALNAAEHRSANFVLFSFDPERDTPAVMHHYAAENNLPAPDWTLLTADDDATLELAVTLGVRYKPLADGDFAHSNLIFVLDCGGTPIHHQEGLGVAPGQAVTAVRSALRQCQGES